MELFNKIDYNVLAHKQLLDLVSIILHCVGIIYIPRNKWFKCVIKVSSMAALLDGYRVVVSCPFRL